MRRRVVSPDSRGSVMQETMKMRTRWFLTLTTIIVAAAAIAAILQARASAGGEPDPRVIAFDAADGQVRTVNTGGEFDAANPFFQDLGTNGRRCVTCHQPQLAWSITPAHVQARFAATHGRDPLF